MPLVVLIPLFDDWQCLPPLLRDLDLALAGENEKARVVVVDDGSPTPCDATNISVGCAVSPSPCSEDG